MDTAGITGVWAIGFGILMGTAIAFVFLLMAAFSSMGIQDRFSEAFACLMVLLAALAFVCFVAWGILRFAAVV